MRRLLTLALPVVLCALVASTVFAEIHFNPAKMMRASEVKAGMIGECWTVLQGTEPAKFHVKILGVLPQSILGKPEILFRVIDGPIVERNAPVMGGMSGSPVFINGRLIGACAYTVLYEKEPAGGITAIEAMIEGATGKPVTEAFVPQPVRLAGRTFTRVAEIGATKPDDHTLLVAPLAPPIYFTSGTESTNAWHSRLLGMIGLEGRPGAGSHDPIKVAMTPGQGFGVALASGDFLSYTFGTITWRDGDDILGFGHPFLNVGKLSVPMTSVYIHDFTPNYRRTDKDGYIMDTVGTMNADSPWAVGGTVGAKCETVPGTYRIVDETADRSKTYHVELAKDRSLTAPTALGTLFDAVNSLHYADGRPGVVQIRYRIRGSGGASVQRSDIFYHSGDFGPAIGSEVGEVMRLLIDNRFEPQQIADLSAEVHLRTEQQVARIERVYTEEEAAVAGRSLTMHVVLKPVGKPLLDKSFRFTLPLNLPKGALMIGVAGGELAPQLRAELSGFQPEFHSLGRVISYIEALELNNQMVAMVAYPFPGAAVEDTPLPGLPQPFRGRLILGHRTGVRAIRDFALQKTDMPWVVQGAYATSIPTVTLQGERGVPEAPKPKPQEGAGGSDKVREAVDVVARGTVPVIDWSAGRMAPVAALQARLTRRSQPVAVSDEEEVDDEDVTPTPAEEKPKQETPKPAAEEKPKADAGQVQAKPAEWVLGKYDELSRGRPDGLAVHTRGWLVPGVRFAHLADLPDPLVWDMAADANAIYVSAGLDGAIYRLAGGKAEPFFSAPGAIFISCLAARGDGTVACATAPGAKVLLLGPDGKLQRSVDFGEDYVWRLLPEGADFLVATGHPARIYRLGPAGEKKLLAVIPEGHVMALAQSPKGLYAGTADTGSVYLVTPSGEVRQLYQTPDGDISGLAVLDDGTVVAAVSAKARIIALRPSGVVEEWYKDDKQKIWDLVAQKDAVIASLGPPSGLIRARGVNDWELLRTDYSQEIFVSLAPNASGQLLVAGCGPGVVMAEDPKPASLSYTSQAHDAALPARWLAAVADCVGDLSGLRLQTRTGASAAFEAGLWSAWSDAPAAGQIFRCASPPGRYMQARLVADPAKTASLRSLIFRYAPQNRPPTLKVSAPAAGAAVSGSFEVKWEATDEDKDTVAVGLCLQALGATTWDDLALHQSTSPYKWDTAKTKDGVYRLRVIAADRPSRPLDFLETSEFLAPLTVDNTKPTAELTSSLKRAADGTVPVEILAQDALSGVAAVSWRYPDTEVWYAAATDDGMWGGKIEVCRFTLPKAIAAATKIIVRIRDAAGNFVDMTLVMPDGEKPKPAATPAKPAPPPAPAAPKGGK